MMTQFQNIWCSDNFGADEFRFWSLHVCIYFQTSTYHRHRHEASFSKKKIRFLAAWSQKALHWVPIQRPVFNNMFAPQGWSLALGVNLAHRGELCLIGGMFTLLFTPGENTLYCLEEWTGEQRISPLGDNFTPMYRGQSSLLEVKVCPLGVKLRMGLWNL
jgi:hypothetical protein